MSRIIRDGHIHSPYCPHGTEDSFELYIGKAIEIGLKEISFTEHMPLPGDFLEPGRHKKCFPDPDLMEEYFRELKLLKEKYKSVIKINAGFEVDFVEGYEEKMKEMLNRFGNMIDDSILSVHMIRLDDGYYCIDARPDEFGMVAEKLGGVEKVYDEYYKTVLKSIRADLGPFKPRRIGHPTLVRIFQKAFPLEYANNELLEEIVREIKKNNYEVDFNTAGMRKPYCGEAYPTGLFADLVKKYGVKVVYGSDSHTASDVGRDFNIML